MPKKFFDIIPPARILPKEKTEEPILEKRTALKKPKKKRGAFGFLVIIAVLLLVPGFVYSVLFSDVDVDIWPKTERITLSETVTVDLNISSVDLAANTISGRLVTSEKVGSAEFASTGQIQTEGKARGKITVYNAYSSSPRNFIPSRFVSADGKLFWSIGSITVPGASQEGGKTIPGEVEITVEAAEPGPEYNIEPTTFALPGLAGTALYTSTYAKSFNTMSGGHRGEVSSVSQDDFNQAGESLISDLNSQSKNELFGSIRDDMVLLDQAIVTETLEEKSSHEVGAGTDKFKIEARVKSEAVAFSQAEIENFILGKVTSDLDSDRIIQEGSLDIEYNVFSVDLGSGQMIIDIEASANIYDDIDVVSVERSLLGKSISESKIFLNSLPKVIKAELNYRPFIRFSMPKNEKDIEINFKFNDDGVDE